MTANPNPAFPKLSERALRRVARLGDGWMSTANTPEGFATNLAAIRRYGDEEGRPVGEGFEASLYYNIHVTDDRDRGMHEVASYLRDYYSVDYDPAFLERWVAIGDPGRCVDLIREFVDAGASTITLRLVGYDEAGQFRRVTQEVLPALVG